MSDTQVYVETEIIRQAQSGSQAAYGELYQRHLSAIHRYIHKRVGGSADAEDLTQTVFLKAWQALRDYQPATTPFRAWLYRIAHNTVIDHYRGQRPTLLWDDLELLADPHGAPEALALASERQETMQRAITTLRPAYQEIIVHRFLHNKDYTEMAAELGHQVNNLRVLQHRALEALRRVLTQEATIGLVVALTLLLLGRHMAVEAAQALPGDSLYPLRTVVEEASLFLADDVTAIRLHTDFAARRLVELQQLLQQRRTAAVATTANNLALHIRSASAQLGRIIQSKPQVGQALRAQFRQNLQQQSATLAKLAATAPQNIQPVLQPVIAALREAQIAPQDPSLPTPTPEPTSTNQDARATRPAPTATPSRPAEPTIAPNSGEAAHKVATPTTVDQATAQSVRASNYRQPPPERQRSLVGAPPTATEPSKATPVQAAKSAEPDGPLPSDQTLVDHPHTANTTNHPAGEQPPAEQAPAGQPQPLATPSFGDVATARDNPASPDPTRPAEEKHKPDAPSAPENRSTTEDTRPANTAQPDRATNSSTGSRKLPRP